MNLRLFFIFCLVLVSFFGCATHKAARQPELSYDLRAQENKIEQDGISYLVKCFHLKSDLETYFDDDLLKYGILPVQINLQNKSYPRPVVLSKSGINLIDPTGTRHPIMPSEQVIDKVKKSYWRAAGWGVAAGIFGIIPSMINVSNTNKKIQADYESRMIKGGNLIRGGVTEGLVFFSVPEDLSSLTGWKVSVILKDIESANDIILEYGLFGTIVPPKERKQKEGEKEGDIYATSPQIETVKPQQIQSSTPKKSPFPSSKQESNTFLTAFEGKYNVTWRAPKNVRILSVGIGSFKDSQIPQVKHARFDGQLFASFVKSSGVPEENINCLTNEDAYRSDITDALMKLKIATTEKSETAIFYFSGHGAPIVRDGKIVDSALVPYDARENSMEYTGIKVSTLHEMLSDVRGNWIIILDACFSGKEGRSLMVKNVKAISVVPKDFNVISKSGANTWWITATSGNNFANDFPKENSGLFTYYFLKALNAEGGVDSNRDGLISMQEAFNWTKKEVQAVSAKSLGRLQVPELIGEGDTILTIPR